MRRRLLVPAVFLAALALATASAQQAPPAPPAEGAAATPSPAPAPAGPGTPWTQEDVAALARMTFPEGVPVDLSTSIAPREMAQGVLLRMLNNPAERAHQPNVVALLGLTGDAQAARALMGLAGRADTGRLTRNEERAKLGSLTALGWLVQRTGDEPALNFLTGNVRPTAWTGKLQWTSDAPAPTDENERMRSFAKLSIMSLGVTGHPRAAAVLQEIAQAPQFADLRAQLPEAGRVAVAATTVNRTVATQGLLGFYGVASRPNVRILHPGTVRQSAAASAAARAGAATGVTPVREIPIVRTAVAPLAPRSAPTPSDSCIPGTFRDGSATCPPPIP